MSVPKIYCATSARSVGCTFLDWSIYWLSGQQEFYQTASRSWIPLIDNPLAKNKLANAHAHLKNHPCGFRAVKLEIAYLKEVASKANISSCYPIPLYLETACEELGIDPSTLADAHTQHLINRYVEQDYRDALTWLWEQSVPVIYVSVDPCARGYFWQNRSRSTDVVQREHQDRYFSESQRIWNDLALSNIWDQRERMALDIRPFDPLEFANFTLPFEHHWINCQTLWFDTEHAVLDAMGYLDLSVDQSRLEIWRPIMTNWQKIHNDQLMFYRSLPEIVEATVKGHYFRLPSLSLWQETIVLHCLIYQHNLNLKSWQLDRFPNNTIDLHALLEPNIHPLG